MFVVVEGVQQRWKGQQNENENDDSGADGDCDSEQNAPDES